MEIITKKRADVLFRLNGYLQEKNTNDLAHAGKLTHRKAKTRVLVKSIKYDVATDNYEIALQADGSVWYVSAKVVLLENMIPYKPTPKYKFLAHFLIELNDALAMDGRAKERLQDVSELIPLEKDVKKLLKVELNANQFTALVSFAYEHGLDNLEKSSLLKKVNQGEFVKASRDFGRWAKRDKKIVRSKAILRQKEKDLFMSEVKE